MHSFLFFAFFALPDSCEAIFKNENQENIEVKVSGSLGFYNFAQKKCFKAFGKDTTNYNKIKEWVSNIAENNENPFIQYSIKQKRMNINKYSVRNGCFFSPCCFFDNGTVFERNECNTNLCSYSLQASNDEKVWTTLHKVEDDKEFSGCKVKTFSVAKTDEYYKYFRFVLDKECKNSLKVMQLNQIEFYGKTESEINADNDFEDDSVSIIGRIINKE